MPGLAIGSSGRARSRTSDRIRWLRQILKRSLTRSRSCSLCALGDRRLAGAVLLDAPLRSRQPDPEQAKQVVVILNVQCQEVVEERPSRKRSWRAARVLRRVFKAVGGGLLVAADVVAPDPTMIVRVASVWGGVDLILDAVEMD